MVENIKMEREKRSLALQIRSVRKRYSGHMGSTSFDRYLSVGERGTEGRGEVGEDWRERVKKILCLDFDGVIHSYTSGWKGPRNIPDPPVPGALEFIVKALEHGFAIQIYSSRSRYWFARRAMKKWLKEHVCAGCEEYQTAYCSPARDLCNASCIWETYFRKLKWPTKKPSAFLTIDDRALTFTGIFPDFEMISNFKPWTKKGI